MSRYVGTGLQYTRILIVVRRSLYSGYQSRIQKKMADAEPPTVPAAEPASAEAASPADAATEPPVEQPAAVQPAAQEEPAAAAPIDPEAPAPGPDPPVDDTQRKKFRAVFSVFELEV